MATHSSVLAWRIPGTGEPGGLLSTGSHRVGHNWSDLAAAACTSCKLFWGFFVALFYSFFLLLLFCDIRSIFSIMFGLLFLFFFVCVSIIYFWFMVTMLLIFLRNIEKDRNRIKILPTVSLFKANHGKNLNIPLRVLSNIYIIVIKTFICIVSFLLLTLTYYHKLLTNISISLFFFFNVYINIHLPLH